MSSTPQRLAQHLLPTLEAVGEAIVESITDAMLTVQPGFRHDLGEDSPLVNSVQYKIDVANSRIVILAYDYIQFVEAGRKPFTQWPPIPQLAKWAIRKGLKPRPGQSFNSMLWAIRQHIWRTPLPGRPFVSRAVDTAGRANMKIIQSIDFSAYFASIARPNA